MATMLPIPTLADLKSDPANASLLASPAPQVSLAPQPAGVPMLKNLLGDQAAPQAPAPGPMDSSGMGGASLPSLPGTLRPLVTNPRAEQEQRLQQRIDAYDMPNPTQPGFWHHLGAIAAKAGNIIGNDFIPHTMAMIPGTDLFKQMQEGKATQQLNAMRMQDDTLANSSSKRALDAATTAKTNTEASEMPAKDASEEGLQDAQTQNLQHPQDTNPDMATYRSLVKLGMAPSEALQEIERDKALALKPATEQHVPVLGDDGKPTFANYDPTKATWTDPAGNPIKNPRPIPPANAGGQVTMVIPQADGSNKVERVGPGQTIAPGAMSTTQFGAQTVANNKENTKEQKSAQSIVDSAATAHELAREAAAGNAPADVDLALAFFKTIKGSDGSGIRFTQAEQNLIKGARSSAGDLEAVGQKVLGGGQLFTPDQRNKILQVMDLHAQAARNHLGGTSTPQTGGGQQGPPKENDTKVNGAGIPVIFKGGKWQAQ
jgi:hypothetical protein